MSIENWWLYGLWVLLTVVLLVLQHLLHKSSQRRSDRIAGGIDKLRSNTAIVSFSVGFDGMEAVCVTDVWTGYAEQCFMSGTIEDALDDAVECRIVFFTGL